MDVVADAGAVLGGIIGAEEVHVGALAQGYLQEHGDDVGFGLVVLADGGVGGAAGDVEVTWGGEGEALGLGDIAENVFNHELGVAVGIDRVLGHIFGHGHFVRDAIGGAGGGEDELANAGGMH